MGEWRICWVSRDPMTVSLLNSIVPNGWCDFPAREREVGVREGDPIFLSPHHRVDVRLTLYGQSRSYRRYTAETRRNYATDLRLFLTFLSARAVDWSEAKPEDVEDYEDWRRFADQNPRTVGGSKWDRELSALNAFYKWAVKHGHIDGSPIATKRVIDRHGAVSDAPAARAKDARPSNVHWLTPRTWRRWTDIGLRGYTAGGVPDLHWAGRLEDRNVAFVRFLVTSGLRRSEGGSLLTFEVPDRALQTGRYCRGRVAAEVTRSKRSRIFYVAADALAEVETYQDSSRAMAVRRAQQSEQYENLLRRRTVTNIGATRTPIVSWIDQDGVEGTRHLDLLTVAQRATLYKEGNHGLEPLWLWLNEKGLPFGVHSWDGVFAVANRRCAAMLTPEHRLGMDPHKVYAPYATPHSTRHSFALYMLVALNTLMDQKYGLTAEDRRDFRQLYGDPWFMVQNLLGHASRETTIEIYLAPVADLQLRSMLADAADSSPAPMRELDDVFARIARDSVGIQDVDDSVDHRDL